MTSHTFTKNKLIVKARDKSKRNNIECDMINEIKWLHLISIDSPKKNLN
jgi:hypothetical protein